MTNRIIKKLSCRRDDFVIPTAGEFFWNKDGSEKSAYSFVSTASSKLVSWNAEGNKLTLVVNTGMLVGFECSRMNRMSSL